MVADDAKRAVSVTCDTQAVQYARAPSADRHLTDLNDAQQEAVRQASGPLVILAGAGTGKTRVISRRAAYAIDTGVVQPARVLLVTFTDKAAREMEQRMAELGQPDVMARTFHAHARRQLLHFWPSWRPGQPPPDTLDSKLPILAPLAQRLPGNYRFRPAKDIADAIEWAKVRRIPPARWERNGGDRAPIPADLFARIYADYERAKARRGLIDFEDMLTLTVELLESDATAAATVQRQKTWISVDEYQDTNPLQERLLELWLGESADLAVVGDPDQTIYTFTGATPEFLLHFLDRHPGAQTVTLTDNYRSSPQVLELANRLTAGGPRSALRPTMPDGPTPTISRLSSEEDELSELVAGMRRLLADGVAASEMAVLVRTNAQLAPIEDALTRAGIEFTVRGQRFYDRREVRQALQLLSRATVAARGSALVDALRELFVGRLGFEPGTDDAGEEARQRSASLETLLGILADMAEADTGLGLPEFLAELETRAARESAARGRGVNLLTYHRAKGLEWEAVFLPALEEGLLPIRQAKSDEALAEERRLLYVGITRARRYLSLTWSRRPSPFLAEVRPVGSVRTIPSAVRQVPVSASAADDPLLGALHAWRRERAKADAVPAYVVAHDSTLREIAEARPQSLAALRRVKGMGPARIDSYGPEILAILVSAR